VAFTPRWGEAAPEVELLLAAQAVVDLPRDDADLLTGCLRVFARRPFPLDPTLLIPLIEHPQLRVRAAVIEVLAQLSHPAVRRAALELAEQGPRRRGALELLARNWQPGDEQVAESLIRAAEGGHREAAHGLLIDFMSVINARPSAPELIPIIRLAYESEPCAMCRYDFVAALLSLDALPDDDRAECRWDAYERTRGLVSSEA
jgi:hypothetical protein